MSMNRSERHRTLLSGKIHRATVTQADLHYVGSLTIDEMLMEAADLIEGEQVQVVDITNGARLTTYVIAGRRGSGVIGINGATAHLIHPGDPHHHHGLSAGSRVRCGRVRARGGACRCPQPNGGVGRGSGAAGAGFYAPDHRPMNHGPGT